MKTHYYRWAVRIRVRQDGAWGVPFLLTTWDGTEIVQTFVTREFARWNASVAREMLSDPGVVVANATAVKVRVTVERVP